MKNYLYLSIAVLLVGGVYLQNILSVSAQDLGFGLGDPAKGAKETFADRWRSGATNIAGSGPQDQGGGAKLLVKCPPFQIVTDNGFNVSLTDTGSVGRSISTNEINGVLFGSDGLVGHWQELGYEQNFAKCILPLLEELRKRKAAERPPVILTSAQRQGVIASAQDLANKTGKSVRVLSSGVQIASVRPTRSGGGFINTVQNFFRPTTPLAPSVNTNTVRPTQPSAPARTGPLIF